MFASLSSFFDSTGFMPHGMCLMWQPVLIWTHVIADGLIALSYFSIPAALIYFAQHRRDFPHVRILYLCGAFIVWCGISHVTSIWTLWVPAYGIQAVIKVITAVVSVTTAIMLWPLLPKALRIPSLGELQAKNALLQKEIADRMTAEMRLHELTVSLERRVEERTQALTDANAHLEREVERRRRSEERLFKAKGEADAANRAKTVFLAGMSHELRSPLTAILGFTQMLDQVYCEGLDARQRGYVKNIQTSGELLLDLIERLLDLTMIESGRSDIRVEPTDVGACLQKACAILEPMARKANITLAVETSRTDPIIVVADPTRLLQIVVNLGSNAIKYNRPGGRVDISMIAHSPEDVIVRFADTGIGIPLRFQTQVFQPFNRLSQDQSNIGGAGIGLALSKRLAQAIGADLTFESIEGQGSIFDITLQRAQKFMVVAGESEAEFVDIPRCRMLYVDDDPRSRSLIDMYARHRPELTVVHVANLNDMRTQINSECPDIILLDINLPIWKGSDWAAEVAHLRNNTDIRVIGVASEVDARTARYAQTANFTDLLAKPIAFRDLAQAICAAMTD